MCLSRPLWWWVLPWRKHQWILWWWWGLCRMCLSRKLWWWVLSWWKQQWILWWWWGLLWRLRFNILVHFMWMSPSSLPSSTFCRLVRLQLWNFIVWQLKLVVSKWASSKDFLIPFKTTWLWAVKMGYFQFFKSIFRPRIHLFILKMIFVLEYQTGTLLITTSLVLFIFIKLHDNKNSFQNVHLDVDISWISPATLWNSTTVTTLMQVMGYVMMKTTIITVMMEGIVVYLNLSQNTALNVNVSRKIKMIQSAVTAFSRLT